ncbi:MAG: IS256 family transposase [Planctomycetota bacterium]
MKRVPPSKTTKARIEELLGTGISEGSPLSELVRLSVEHIVEEALEAKVEEILGRGYYERGAGPGYRNGYRQGRLKTSEGRVEYAVPQVRDAEGAGELRAFRELLGGRSDELERLAIEMYARGCSTRDIEAIFGPGMLSRSSVSELTEQLWAEYEAFATRDLSEIRPLYLFVDGLYERLRPGAKREAILCAWCLTWAGKKVLVGLAPGLKESKDDCRDFLQDLQRRGLSEPVLVATDGALGVIAAVETCWPAALRQRCLAHKMRNLLAKVPEEVRAEFRTAAKAAYQAPSPKLAEVLREDLVARYKHEHPSAVRCFEEDFEACIAHLHCPSAHRKAIRTTNLLERLFGEERRRMKAVGTFFGERPVLKLMYATLIRATENWRGITVTEFEARQLRELYERREQERKQENRTETSSASDRVYSKSRT